MADIATRRSRVGVRSLIYIVLILGSCLFLIPFLWMLLTSIKTLGETTQVPPILIPTVPQWQNYTEAMSALPFVQFYFNTIVMTIGRTLGQLLFCSLAAYAFARIEFPGRTVLFIVMLSVLMVPGSTFLLPQYLLMRDLGWINSIQALIVPGMFSAFGTFLLRQYFLTIPKELDEAAQVDGANHLQIYWRILLPLTKPALIALAIFTILWSWNELMWPLVVTNSPEKMPLSVGLSMLQGEHTTDFSILMAGAVLVSWPMLVMFMVFQRYFIEGIAITGSKG